MAKSPNFQRKEEIPEGTWEYHEASSMARHGEQACDLATEKAERSWAIQQDHV